MHLCMNDINKTHHLSHTLVYYFFKFRIYDHNILYAFVWLAKEYNTRYKSLSHTLKFRIYIITTFCMYLYGWQKNEYMYV